MPGDCDFLVSCVILYINIFIYIKKKKKKWIASKRYRFAPPVYQWFAETVASLNEHFYPLALFRGKSRSITTQK